MLTLQGDSFTCGRSRFADQHPKFPEPTAKIFVKIKFLEVKRLGIAQVDTGAAYSILETEIALALGLVDHPGGLRTRVSTRFGTLSGELVWVPLTLIADEGSSLTLVGTFFVSRDWRGGTFLGYTGLLDRLRIALDAPANLFYFGEEG
jgi:hypothetical protein